ncbi:hypothetical protein GCM10009839_83110 [Catenulispora yoronensis]|uniref:Peptidase S8 and S53 subtilisin kexin sedolisin n=1 Tax=Catenulispora yoronensis TaxID=450799 RepID=A0ABP5H0S4_9ACTN
MAAVGRVAGPALGLGLTLAVGAGVGVGVGVVGPAAPARAAAVAGPCPDAQAALLAFNASRAWSVAGTKGLGVTIGVVGSPDRVAEAVCAARALAPEATVRPGTASGAIVVVADASVDPNTVGGGALAVAAAGDTSGPMPSRSPGIVNVAAADASGAPLSTSSYGPQVTMAAYGTDTATAAGYVAALAALLRADHGNWPARQVVAQEAGSINPVSGYPHTDQLGFGIIQPVQALSLPPVDPAALPGFEAMFPANQPPRSAPASPRSASSPASQPSDSAGSAGSAGSGTATAPSGAGSGSATGAATAPADGSATDGSTAGAPSDSGLATSGGPAIPTDTAQQWPTNPLSTAGTANLAGSTGGKGGGSSGGVSPVLFIGLLVLVGGGGYVLWQRRRQPQTAPTPPPSEWEAPSGPRHSGYSPPEE